MKMNESNERKEGKNERRGKEKKGMIMRNDNEEWKEKRKGGQEKSVRVASEREREREYIITLVLSSFLPS